MHLKDLRRGELLAVLGGIVLGVSLFLNWYDLGNQHAMLNSCRGPHTVCSGWDSLKFLRYLILLTALAPAILAYIIVRGHALSWPRGELTALTALAALTFTIFRGVIAVPAAPNSPSGEISVDYGWWVALLAGIVILAGSLMRSRESGPRRKPPGVI